MKNIMKRSLSYFLAIAMLLTLLTVGAVTSVSAAPATADVWDGTVGTGFDGGEGTEAKPYLISSAKTLAYLAQVTNTATHAWDADRNPTVQKHYKLTCDIDLNNKPWTPIGYFSTGAQDGAVTFSGIFQGEGHVIYNLNVTTYNGTKNADNVCAGLFGAIFVGKIYNLGIESGIVTATSGYAGGIAGGLFNASIIQNCYNKAKIVKAEGTSFTMIGGIAGKIHDAGTIINCINYSEIDGSVATAWNTNNNFGGIVSYNVNGTVDGCFNYGRVSAGNCRGGGIVARQQGGTVQNSYSSGIIIGTNNARGILIGDAIGGTFANLSYYAAKQTATVNAVGTDTSALAANKVTQVYAEMLIGASVRCATPTGLRFETAIDADQYELWEASGTVTVGTLIAPAQYVTAAGAFTHAALDAYKTSANLTSEAYLDVAYTASTWRTGSTNDEYIFSGAVANILPANYTLDFAAVGYIAVNDGTTTTYYYASYNARDNFRSIKTVVDAVVADPAHGLSDENFAIVQEMKQTIDAALNP